MRLSQSLMLSQKVLVLTLGIIHGRPVLDVSLTPLNKLFSQAIAMQDTAIEEFGLPILDSFSGPTYTTLGSRPVSKALP